MDDRHRSLGVRWLRRLAVGAALVSLAAHGRAFEIPLRSPACALAFSADGRYLAIAGESGSLLLFDLTVPDIEREIQLGSPARALAFAPDRPELAAGLDNKDILVISLTMGRRRRNSAGRWSTPPQNIKVLRGHLKPPAWIEFRGMGILESGVGADSIVWDTAAARKVSRGGRGLKKSPAPDSRCADRVAGSADGAPPLCAIQGDYVAVAAGAGAVKVERVSAALVSIHSQPAPDIPRTPPPAVVVTPAGTLVDEPPSSGEVALLLGVLAFVCCAGIYFLWRFLSRLVAGSRRERLLAAAREGLVSAPGPAYDAFMEFVSLGGDAGELTPSQAADLVLAAGKEDDLAVRTQSLTVAQLLEVCLRVAGSGRVEHAVRLMGSDPRIPGAVSDKAGLEALISIYRQGGLLDSLFHAACSSPVPGLVMSLADALLQEGSPQKCVDLLRMRKDKLPGEYRLLAKALAGMGLREEVLAVFEELGLVEWDMEEIVACFELSVDLGRVVMALRLHPRVLAARPLAQHPDLHYGFGRKLEELGEPALALEVYRRFITADISHRDVLERFRALKEGSLLAAPEARSEAALPPPGSSGKYEIRHKIGVGGMGEVFEGFDSSLGRRVALKRLRPELKSSRKLRERFLQEAKIISHLSHPFIVGIHEILETADELFLVFDFVDGKSLSDILDQRQRLGSEECRRIFGPVCQAVEHAHRCRVLHRDLKPSNIMVDADGFVHVMDFGLAREAKDSLSCITQADISGTPAYMAPEQHLGNAVQASDIYATGVCLYECLTGNLPFKGPDFLEQKKRADYVPPSRVIAELSRNADLLMASVLAPDPKRRVKDASELCELLKDV